MGNKITAENAAVTDPAPREFKYDNIRALLILLVVFAHLLEQFSGSARNITYTVIYTFHMPCFIFITGYFARFDQKKFLKRLVLPYVIFQPLYLLFGYFVTHTLKTFTFQFSTPYWILWYFFTVICYYLLLPVIKTSKPKTALIVLGVCVVLAIGAGFDKSIGRVFSLSRTIVFFPFFAAGYYFKNIFQNEKVIENREKAKKIAVCISTFVVVFGSTLAVVLKVPKKILYGSYSYSAAQSNAFIRTLLFIVAAAWIVVLLYAIPNKRIPLVSSLGKSTLPVFLLHGFVVRGLSALRFFKVLGCPQWANLLIALGISVILCALFGNPLMRKLFAKLF